MARRTTNRAVAKAAAETGVRVAIYIRRSTDEEHQPFSLEAQLSKLRSYVQSQPGWSLVATYSDDASGAKLERPGLRDALTAAHGGLFDVMLVYRVDRFTTLLDELDEAGVAFRSATEPFDTSTPAGRMLVQMLGVFAEFEREMIIDRVINGMERKAAKRRWTLGTTPYGYSTAPETHQLLVADTEAAVVEEIFTLYTYRRLGTRAIAKTLNDRGLRRRSGRAWSFKTVTDVLTNHAYVGEIHFRDIFAGNAHQPIIEQATFDLADRILLERGENPAKRAIASSDYHLTGKIACPSCGRRYLGTLATGKSRTYRYYTCFTRSRYGTSHCPAPRLDADRLDDHMLAALRDFYTNRVDLITETITAARRDHHKARVLYDAELATAKAQLAAKEAVVDKYLSDYEDDTIDKDTVARRINKISEEIRQLRHRRDELQLKIDAEPEELTAADLAAIRDHIAHIIDSGTTPERKALCDALIEKLQINGDRTATPVFRVPLTTHGSTILLERPTSANAQSQGVRERTPRVGRRLRHTNTCTAVLSCAFSLPLVRERRSPSLPRTG